MSTRVVRMLTLLAAVLVLGSVNYSIYSKEHIKRHGEVIYLELAPVDPRSLMQGDYMALRFGIAEAIERDRHREDTSVALHLDARRVASVAAPDSAGALRMHYRIRNGRVWLGTNAYFFQEGSGARFAQARYGEFRVDPESGEAVLVALCDDRLRAL